MSSHRGFPRSAFPSGLAGLLAAFLFALSPPGRGAAVVSTPGGIGAACVAPAPGIEVIFRCAVVDLADTTPGQDLWEYRYQVTGLTLTVGQGFTIFFDLGLYTLLQSPPPFANADFNLLVAQPDLALNSNGFYDALASRNNPSFADPFTLRFVWLGTAGSTPGAQPYTVYNADFTTKSQGQTTNVPEPSAMALLLAAFGAFVSRKRERIPSPPRAQTPFGHALVPATLLPSAPPRRKRPMNRAASELEFRVARSSRALVAASRRDELPKTSKLK